MTEIGSIRDYQERSEYLKKREEFFKQAMRPGTVKSVTEAILECLAVRKIQEKEPT